MTKDIIKKGYELANKELEDKQIEKVKDIVKGTLSKIKDLDEDISKAKEQIKELEEQKKVLRLDIDDLKEGRLDRIEERQKTDIKTKKISVIIVEKEVHHHHYDRWHEPYKITYIPYYPPVTHPTPFFGHIATDNSNDYMKLCHTTSTTTTPMVGLAISASTGNINNATFTVNSSLTKNNVIGTYNIGGTTVHLR